MATKTKVPQATPEAKRAKIARAEDPARKAQAADDAMNTARVMQNGQCNAVVVQQYLHFVNDGSSALALSKVSLKDAVAIGSGDLSSLEHMLLTQATALQAMFVDLALRAKRQDRFDGIQILTALALKCAAQSRQAVTALAELHQPRSVMFAKQANVSSGPQQVNNGVVALPSPARAEEIQTRPNELSGASHGLLENTRTSCSAGGVDPRMATVGALDRAEVTRR